MHLADLEVLLSLIALIAAFLALCVAVSEWLMAVPQKPEDPGDTALAWGQAALSRHWGRRLLEEAMWPSQFMRFLPRYESHYEVIFGEVIRFVERIEPETTGGGQISIEGVRNLLAPVWEATGREEALRFYGIREESEALRSALHRGCAEAQARFEPPTSACSRCGRTFPVADLYTGKKSGRQACERCLGVMVEAGLATKPAEF